MDIHGLQPYHPQAVYNHQIHIYLLGEWMLLEVSTPLSRCPSWLSQVQSTWSSK